MSKRYVVVRGVYSPCGMHPGPRWKACAMCARAAEATRAALAGVTPKPSTGMHDTSRTACMTAASPRPQYARRGVGPLSDATVTRIRALRAEGWSYPRISRETGASESAVRDICIGRSYNGKARSTVAVIGTQQKGFGGAARRKHYAETQPFVGHASR